MRMFFKQMKWWLCEITHNGKHDYIYDKRVGMFHFFKCKRCGHPMLLKD